MDDLDHVLNGVGMAVFARFYAQFADPRDADAEIVEMLPRECTLKSRRSRIVRSEKTDAEASALAARLLRKP